MKQITAFESEIRRIEFSYKGIHIMVVGESNTIKLWSLKSLEQDPKEFNVSLASINFIAFDKNAHFIFVSNDKDSEFLSVKENITIHA